MRWSILVFLAAIGCSRGDRAPAPDTLPAEAESLQVEPRTSLARMALPPASVETTVTLTHFFDSTKVGDTVAFKRWHWRDTTIRHRREIVESTWVRLPPAALGLPNGPFHLPPDSLCAPLGYNATFRFASSSGRYLVNDLKVVKRCKGRVIVGVSRSKLKSTPDTGLSVANGIAEIAKWPWTELQPFLTDGTILGFYAGDDVSSTEWGKASMAMRLARWDSIYAEFTRRAPTVARMIRSKPTELRDWGYAGRNITTAWAQYRGPYRDKAPTDWIAAQVTAAKALKLGLVIGPNYLDGGCGPPTLYDGKTNTSCLPNVPGTGILGTTPNAASVRRYQMSAAELSYYGAAMIAEPYNCAMIGWAWSESFTASPKPERPAEQIAGARAFHAREDVRSVAKALGALAQKRNPASCIHPDRR